MSMQPDSAARNTAELKLESVTFIRELKTAPKTVLQNVTFTLRSGEKVGLVGRNGAGKTTLLELLAGRLSPTEGQLVRAPGLQVAYAEQHTERWRGTVWHVAEGALGRVRGLEAALRDAETRLDEFGLERYGELSALFEAAGGYAAETTLRATLDRLGFAEPDLKRDVLTLSGGERARLALAYALAQRADLLLLDEPSSYLDLPGKRWLGDALAAYPGALLVASHDRALLDAATTRTLHLENGAVTSYRGSYSRFRAQAEHAAARSLRETTRLAHERRSLAARLRDQPTLSARRGLERRLARLPAAPPTSPKAKAASLTLDAVTPKPATTPVLTAQHLTLTQGDKPLFNDVSMRLYAGDKVALIGPNGSGKTSLLAILSGALESEDPEAAVHFGRGVRLAVFDQVNRGLDDGVPLGRQLGQSVSEPRARSLLALVGLAESFSTPPELLSSGQRARAGIARLLAAEADLIFLDEPGEGLDIEMLERLETALQDTAATLILVSHDAALVDAVATRVIGLSDGQLKEYRGGLAGYYAGTLRLEPDLLKAEPEPDTADKPNLEAELGALEAETVDLEARLADPLRLSARDRERLEKRLHELIHLRSERYDARLLAPAPRYRVLESGLSLTTNGATGSDAPIIMQSSAGFNVLLYLDAHTHIGHLRLRQDDHERCLLPWAERALIRGAARLAFEVFGAKALQLQRSGATNDAFSATGFSLAGNNWWVQDREHYAAREGFLRPAQATPSKQSRPNRRRRRKRKEPPKARRSS